MTRNWKKLATTAGLACLLFTASALSAVPGDLNDDGTVDSADLAALEAGFFTAGAAADLDGDGRVSYADLAILRAALVGETGRPAAARSGTDSVSLSGPAETRVGEFFEVTVDGDFTAVPTLGGGLDVTWDGSQAILTDVLVTAPDTNPAFTRPGDISDGNLNGLAFGRFDGFDGPIEIAVLTFEAVGAGDLNLSVGPNSIPAGPLVDFNGDPIDPLTYTGLSLIVMPGPTIDVNPSSLDFGETTLTVAEVTVANLGEADLLIGSVGAGVAPEPPFSIVGDTCSDAAISAAGSCTIDVEFAPDTNEAFAASFDIPSNDPVNPSVVVTLSGIGTAVQPVFVTDSENDLVARINLGTGRVSQFASLAGGEEPSGVAIDDEQHVYVSLRAGQQNIVRFDTDGNPLGEFAASVDSAGFGLIDFASDNTLVAGPRSAPASAYRFEASGDLLEIVPAPDGETRFIVSTYVFGQVILAADAGSGDIFRIDTAVANSQPELFIAGNMAPARPHGMSIGHNGNLFVAGMQSIYEFDASTGEFVSPFVADYKQLGISLRPSGGGFPFESGEMVYLAEQGIYLLTTQTDSLYAINTAGQLVATYSSDLLGRAFGIAALPIGVTTAFEADPASVAPGTDVSEAYPNLTLSAAEGTVSGSNGVIFTPLELTSDNRAPVFSNGSSFEHAAGSLWSAGPCCGQNTVLRADFGLPASRVAVVFLPDDLDFGVLQAYGANDALIAERSIFNSLPSTIELSSDNPPIAYALATYVDLGLLGKLSFDTSVAPQTMIGVAPVEVSFDAVPIGATADGQVEVSNDGDNVLLLGTLGSEESLESPFTLNSDDCSERRLLPAETCSASIQFNPSSGGTFLDSIDIQSNDPDIPAFVVQVTGRVDRDADGVSDDADNCLELFNPDQRDTDGDAIGNRCDPDFVNDCFINHADLAVMSDNFFIAGDLVTDLNGDGSTNFADLDILTRFFFRRPGPTGLPADCDCPDDATDAARGVPCGPRP